MRDYNCITFNSSRSFLIFRYREYGFELHIQLNNPCFPNITFVDTKCERATSIAETNVNFVCATLDWWPTEKCNYNQYPWGKAGLLNLDLKKKGANKCNKSIQSFKNQSWWVVARLSGSDSYIRVECSSWKKLITNQKGCFGWRFTIAKCKGFHEVYYFQGIQRNQLSIVGMGASVEAEQYGKDIVVLKNLVKELHPDPKTQPQVLGPSGYYDEKWFNSFLKVLGQEVVDGSGAWVSESGRALHSSAKDLFALNKYFDQLGMASTYNHKVFYRQTLINGNYALLNTTTSIPNLDYYGALLWHRFMGSTVLVVTQESNKNLCVYAHCAKKKVSEL
ncbi:hypothetical protein CXB51_024453 [Gossypium anomalum]|uniref:Uncharacterized protein n=1 Tax=Gossypium anomalum TaxID=47600 RepID=A0A8J5YD43_9ROSI|nr:hypothetical protein CXB51_024453 [Gossypium anomalum]